MAVSGIININKAQDFTSFDCVAIVRRVLGIKKVGHTGTLDPMATGVLPCCVGTATRILEYLDEDEKEYRGTLKLGVETDTCDIWGDVTSCREVAIGKDVSVKDVESAFSAMKGPILQIPPAYAAIKVDGRKLYEYARKGETVEVKPRPVTIHEIVIEDMEEDTVDFRVVCSKGTYIRSLCRDIGKTLGVGGTMAALERSRTGAFAIGESLPIEAVKTMTQEELAGHLIPMDRALTGYPRVDLDRPQGLNFLDGKTVRFRRDPYRETNVGSGASEDSAGAKKDNAEAWQYIRVYAEDAFLGMATLSEEDKLKPAKVLGTEYRELWKSM